MLKKVYAWLPVLAWMALIFRLSDQPQVVPPLNPTLSLIISSLGHIVFYAILYILTHRALRGSFKSHFVNLLSLSIVLVYGISDEFHQSFVPGRTASIIDVGLDLLGGILSAKIWK